LADNDTGQLEMDRSDEGVRNVCEHILQFQLDEGGFSSYTLEGAWKEYEWSRDIPSFSSSCSVFLRVAAHSHPRPHL